MTLYLLANRCDDLNAQNGVLHEHLETFGSQAAKIQSRTEMTDEPMGLTAAENDSASASSSSEQLREVIRYLRREKDIIDLQLEFSKQEATRLRQQLEFATRNLEESRQSLVEVSYPISPDEVSSSVCSSCDFYRSEPRLVYPRRLLYSMLSCSSESIRRMSCARATRRFETRTR